MAKKRKKREPLNVVPIGYLSEGSEARVASVAKHHGVSEEHAKGICESFALARAALDLLEHGGDIASAAWRLVDAAGLLTEIDAEYAVTSWYVVKRPPRRNTSR